MQNFWQKLPKPFFCLAPMADVTDCAFRQIIAKYGKPDVFFTEFVSVDGLLSAGYKKLLVDLKYSEIERPIVAQIFGNKPENFEKVARMLVKMGFDGIDINMGCPVKKVINQSSCSALIQTPDLAKEIILATKRGAGNIPVSVKTRIGFSKIEVDTWIPKILETEPAALTVHLRTVKEMSSVPAHWNIMSKIVEIRDKMAKDTLIIGNGDILDLNEAKQKAKETLCDGVMLGRAIFGNPWLFNDSAPSNFLPLRPSLGASGSKRDPREQKIERGFVPALQQKLKVMLEHTKLFEKILDKHKNFAIMKKHYKAYVSDFNGAKELRVKLMETKNLSGVQTIVNDFLDKI